MTNHVSFGDIVYIEFDKLILFANDIYNPTLYLVSTQNIAQKSFRNGLFKLYPDLSDKFASEESKLGDQNIKLYEESKGQPIVYGDKVQLFHIESQSFVSLSQIFNKEDQVINLELSKRGSKNLYLSFMSKQAHNQEEQMVEYGAPLKLVSCKADIFLTKRSEIDLTKIKTELNPISNKMCKSEEFPKIAPRRKEPIFQVEKLYQTGMAFKEPQGNVFLRKFVSLEEDNKANTEKALKNGDYIRISNGKHFLYFGQTRDENHLKYFQSFRGNYGYKYNNILTLFQIQEDFSVNEDEPNQLPEGKILEFGENKKYTLKHVISGLYLALKNGEFTLIDPSATQGDKKFSIVGKDVSKSLNNQIDKNSVLHLNFYSEALQKDNFLNLGQPIKIPNVQLELNTLFFFGFYNPQNYLNKWLRVERFNINALSVADKESSSFKILKVTEEEFSSILLIESFTNYLQKFYDVFDAFSTDDIFSNNKSLLENFDKNGLPKELIIEEIPVPVRALNDMIKRLNEICLKFSQEIYETDFIEENEDVLIPHTLRQTLLREFRAFDLMYQLINHLTGEDLTKKLFDTKFSKPFEEEKPNETAETKAEEGDTTITTNKEIITKDDPKSGTPPNIGVDENTELNFTSCIQLLNHFKKIILISFKNNDLNQFYCSQFVRIPIRGITMMHDSVFALASEKEQLIAKEILLVLAKEGLWDMDLDGLGQLNFYETDLFSCIENQRDYHSVYLKLLIHISKSKAPNLQNSIRDNFVRNFIAEPENFVHVFPQIIEKENKVYLKFQRKNFDDKDTELCLDDLVEQNLSPKLKTESNILMNYFKNSLDLICALSTIQSKGYELQIIAHFSHSELTKLLKIFKAAQYKDIRVLIEETLGKIHKQYYNPPFTQLPKQIKILYAQGRTEIHKSIENAMETFISDVENEKIKAISEEENVVKELKVTLLSEKPKNDILEILDLNPTIDQPEFARAILEGIKKELESSFDLKYDFITKARNMVIKLITQAIKKNNNESNNFIKCALEVFDQIEKKHFGLMALKFAEEKDDINTVIESSGTLPLLLDIVTLKQDRLLSDVIKHLKREASFEKNLNRELFKIVILEDKESINKMKKLVGITLRLANITREVEFCKDKYIDIENDRLNTIFNEVYELHWEFFFMIYDTSKHFRYPNPEIHHEKRFRKAYEIEKNIRWDYCLKLNPEAINKNCQIIFNLLKTHEVIIKAQHWLLEKTQGFTEDYLTRLKSLRLNFLILTAFVYKNKENQKLFANYKGIIRQYYNQHFMNQSSDALFAFAETHRDNKKLLKLPAKYQYDITLSSYIGTITRAVSNTSSNGYLAATLTCYHYLCRALIPIELFNPLSDLKTKWGQIANVNSFTKLNLLTNTEEYLPYGYFEVRETMIACLENFDHLAANEKSLNEIQSFLPFQKWIEFFSSENFFLQFELKNYLCKCISKFYFENKGKINLIETQEDCLAFISSLVAEIIFFRGHTTYKKGQDASSLHKLDQTPNFIINHSNYISIMELYNKAGDINFENKKPKIYLEEISLYNLLREYIYDGCLDLLFNVLLKEVVYCKAIQDENGEMQTIIDFALELIEEVIRYEDNDALFPHSKLENFLNKASEIQVYSENRTKIIDLIGKLQSKAKSPVNSIEEKETSKDKLVGNDFENSFKSELVLSSKKKENKKQNIRKIAQHIKKHPKAKEIIYELIKYLKRYVKTLEHDEIIFILRVLRKFIEIENTNNPDDEPLNMWKEVPYSDLQNIEEIQYLYREFGLSELLFSVFTVNDQKVFKEAILLSLAYIYSGNLVVQQDLFGQFEEEDENKVLDQIENFLKIEDSKED